MKKYTDLDKELKQIRNKWEYDLYQVNLESQKLIDKFYNEDIPENDMICRYFLAKINGNSFGNQGEEKQL